MSLGLWQRGRLRLPAILIGTDEVLQFLSGGIVSFHCRIQRLRLRVLRVRLGYEALCLKLINHPVPALDGSIGLSHWMIIGRTLEQYCQIRSFCKRRAVYGLAEVVHRCCGYSVGALAKI